MSSRIHSSEDSLQDLTQALDADGPRNDLSDFTGPVFITFEIEIIYPNLKTTPCYFSYKPFPKNLFTAPI